MGLEYLKRWHWMIIGLLFGAIFGGTRIMFRDADPGGERSYDRAQFQEMIRRGMEVRNLVLHPPIDGQEWITGEAKKYRNGTFSAVIQPTGRRWWLLGGGGKATTKPAANAKPNEQPFDWVAFPLLAGDATSSRPVYQKPATAAEYIANLQKSFPRVKDTLSYKTAWWEAPKYTVAMYTVGGFIVIGVIWPTIASLLAGAGFGKQRPKEEYDLDRFKSEPEPVAAASPIGQGNDQLAELNAKLEADVAGMMLGKTEIEQEDEEEEAAIKQLQMQSMDAVETAAEKADREAREYKGEFYPVAKPVVHKDEK